MSRKLQVKRGNEADMPTLAAGEMGFALDSKRLFVGAGNENVPINSGRMQEEAAEVAEISTNVTAINNKMGSANDTTGTATAGTLMGKINTLITKFTSRWTDARAVKLDNLDATISGRAPASTALSTTTWTNARATNLDTLINGTYGLAAVKTLIDTQGTKIGITTDTGGTDTAGTMMAKLNAIYANSQNASVVKSVRRGVGVLSAGSGRVSVGSINSEKCYATVRGTATSTSNANAIHEVYISILSSYWLYVESISNNASGYFSYEIIEFY